MARVNKNLSNVFNKFSHKENVSVGHNTKNDDVTGLSNTEQKHVAQTSNTNQEDVAQTSNTETVTLQHVRNTILDKYEEKTKRQTVEDTHQRTTFLFRKDLLRRLDKLTKGKRGFKTMFINEAIEALLNEWEKK